LKLPRALLHRQIRQKAGLATIPAGRFRVSVARTVREYEAAFRLVQSAYVADGIESTDSPALRVFGHHLMKEATVLVAYERDRLVGTITLLEDSAAGLLLDNDYPREMCDLRMAAARVAEICALTVVRRCRHHGVAQLLSLAATRYGFVHRACTHIVVGVNPRASDYYAAVWGMRRFAGAQDHAQLHAPVIGFVGPREDVRAHLGRHCHKQAAQGGTFLDHVFGSHTLPEVILPDVGDDSLTRWKMPREVFRELFMERTQALNDLTPGLRDQLAQQRSRATWMGEEPPVTAAEASDALGTAGDER
jgi:hypothetical protein